MLLRHRRRQTLGQEGIAFTLEEPTEAQVLEALEARIEVIREVAEATITAEVADQAEATTIEVQEVLAGISTAEAQEVLAEATRAEVVEAQEVVDHQGLLQEAQAEEEEDSPSRNKLMRIGRVR